ncbi:MAG: class I SAM-dependent methyltransferase [Candidatus Bathyarchaeota archaeon]|nr:class I SAM-dependent methyltransferase [Candidatus Termiticorpusculum sp.]
MRFISKPDNTKIAEMWDSLAIKRQRCIAEGTDTTFMYVICPHILSLLAEYPEDSRIIDLGCGTGSLTHAIANRHKSVVGLDISESSIALASNSNTHENSDVKFICTSIEEYAKNTLAKYDVAVASMLFSNVVDLNNTISAISSLLVDRGTLLILMPHPVFWPYYWDFAFFNDYNYSKEQYIETDFVISSDTNCGSSIYIHRPLDQYFSAFLRNFNIDRFMEIVACKDFDSRILSEFKLPRLISLVLHKK